MVRSEQTVNVLYYLIICEKKNLHRSLIKTHDVGAFCLALNHIHKNIDKVEYYLTGSLVVGG